MCQTDYTCCVVCNSLLVTFSVVYSGMLALIGPHRPYMGSNLNQTNSRDMYCGTRPTNRTLVMNRSSLAFVIPERDDMFNTAVIQ